MIVIPLKCMVFDCASTARMRPKVDNFALIVRMKPTGVQSCRGAKHGKFCSCKYDCCTIKDKDRYGRLVVECFVNGKNINKQLLRDGFALAFKEYSNDYTQDEEYGSKAKAGFSQFIMGLEKGERLAQDTHNDSDRAKLRKHQ